VIAEQQISETEKCGSRIKQKTRKRVGIKVTKGVKLVTPPAC